MHQIKMNAGPLGDELKCVASQSSVTISVDGKALKALSASYHYDPETGAVIDIVTKARAEKKAPAKAKAKAKK